MPEHPDPTHPAEARLEIVLDAASAVPPFEQLRTRIAALVADGDLVHGARLPTVRQLAAELGLAANTVARSYRELEADGVLATQGRRGTFVQSEALQGDLPPALAAMVSDLVRSARRSGLSEREVVRLVEQGWRAG